ncbi:MAG: hypothetical protein KDN22_06620 [Verrucomicrobiae bacterium]|nr:hypothetical protein [Verrucomicrobiae bacterium]
MAEDYPSKLDWVYTAQGKRRLWWFLGGVCALTLAIELVYWIFRPTAEPGHGNEAATSFPGEFALLGFVSCTIMIVVAKLLGYVLKVSPDFYGKGGGNG